MRSERVVMHLNTWCAIEKLKTQIGIRTAVKHELFFVFFFFLS